MEKLQIAQNRLSDRLATSQNTLKPKEKPEYKERT
jgi:hypothetical protein